MNSRALTMASLVLMSACSKSSATTDAPSPPLTSSPSSPASPSASSSSSSIADASPPSFTDIDGGKDVVKFVALGDTGKGSDAARRVARALADKCEKDGCDFAVLLGDNVYENGADSPNDPKIVDRFENVYSVVPLDFYPVLGNHDYGGYGLGTDFKKGANEVQYSRISKKWKMTGAYYTLSFGVLDVFALDTNMAMFDEVAAQKKMMNAAIAASHAPWKLALGHHPYYSNGPHGNAGNYGGMKLGPASLSGSHVKDFLEQVVCGKVDVYLCGHDHSLQWMQDTCNGTELGISGAGAETTDLRGHDPTRFQSLSLGFLYVVVTRDSFSTEFVSDKGISMFSRTIHKP